MRSALTFATCSRRSSPTIASWNRRRRRSCRSPSLSRRYSWGNIEMIFDKLVADKGYISKNLFQKLFVDGIQLITKLKSNMKGALMSVSDRVLLRKRAIIESVNDELKNIAQIEHSRHRSVCNFAANLLGAVVAYCYFPKKP